MLNSEKIKLVSGIAKLLQKGEKSGFHFRMNLQQTTLTIITQEDWNTCLHHNIILGKHTKMCSVKLWSTVQPLNLC